MRETIFKKKSATANFSIFCFKITDQNRTGSRMGSCYLGYHIAEDHIHMGTASCKHIEESQPKFRL